MSLGTSPSAGTSLPSPPHAAGSLPRGGGILLKTPEDAAAAAAARNRRISEPGSPIRIEPPSGPSSPLEEKISSPLETGGSVTGTTPRIRFAPLPDPTRPRSTSAGNESAWSPDADGGGQDGHHQTVLVNYDNAVESEDDDDDDESREKRGRRWSKSMSMGMGSVDWGSGWKGTKKVLTLGLIGDEDEEGYSNGAPLKKSVSTGGMMGASPFRWTAETERKKTMLGSSPGGPSGSLLSPKDAAAGHRRASSIETPAVQLGSSPAKPMKLLNGRVYGGRRASEAAAAEKQRREKNEPEFVEWGNGKSGGIGSNQPSASRSASSGIGSSRDDDDDGSGMEWVRRRRQRREQEERERKEREAKERESGSGGETSEDSPTNEHEQGQGKSSTSNSSQSTQSPLPITPALHLSELPPTPIIHVSEHLTPSVSAPMPMPSHPGGPLTPITEIKGESKPTTPIGIVPAMTKRTEHDMFDHGHGKRDSRRRRESDNEAESDDEDVDEDEEEEEEDDDEGDFSSDEEEEEEFRTTSSAAGIEKVSRHREQHQPQTPIQEVAPQVPAQS